MPKLFTALALGLVLCGCGTARGDTEARSTPATSPSLTTTPSQLQPLKGPDFRLHLASGDVDLKAWTACYGNGCYDGMPREPFVDAGRATAVEFSFAHPGWKFEATFKDSSGTCPRTITTDATRLSPTRFRIEPAGNPGTWDVDIFGRGPEGDAVTTFRWRTEAAGHFPAVAASNLAVLAKDDGRLTTYGVELNLGDLALTPHRASAVVTVTAANGKQVTLDLGRAKNTECAAAGEAFWTLPEEAAKQATRLPGTDFGYRVDLLLDGVRYVGRGAWPRDTNEEINPGIPLIWTPTLPVYRG